MNAAVRNERIKKAALKMMDDSIDYLVISDITSIYYLTGIKVHTGERMFTLLLSKEGTARFYIHQMFSLDTQIETVYFTDVQNPVSLLCEALNKDSIVGIDKNWPSRFLLSMIEEIKDIKCINGSYVIDRLRAIKSPEEIALMKESSRLNDLAMERMMKLLSANLSEEQMAQKLSEIYEELGAEGASFTPIIGYGKNCADPHHENDSTTPSNGDSVIIDIGCIHESYCSDMTRTFFIGEVSESDRKVYEICREANERAIALVRPGVRFSDLDREARNYIAENGYGDKFTHRLGHSIGLDVHDFGDVSQANDDVLETGMIFSIEPGIYIEGRMGVRIEDLVLVTENGCEVLNSFGKELQTI